MRYVGFFFFFFSFNVVQMYNDQCISSQCEKCVRVCVCVCVCPRVCSENLLDLNLAS